MIQVKKFKDSIDDNGYLKAEIELNKWIQENPTIKIIEIKYQVIWGNGIAYNFILLIYDNFNLPDNTNRHVINSLKNFEAMKDED